MLVGMARVVSTVRAYEELADTPSDVEIDESRWVGSYEARHRSIFDSYYTGWGVVGTRSIAASRVRDLAPEVASRESRARALLESTERAMQALGLLAEEVDAVLLVGVGGSNGWVTRWAGAPTLFLALEVLPEPPYDEILVAHEMTHLVHEREHQETWPETVGTRLFSEGLAGALSRHIVPGHRLDAYLWFDDAHERWLSDCADRVREISDLALADLGLAEDRGARFFSARPDLADGLPVRSGYWLGQRAVQLLVDGDREGSPRQLLGWDATTAVRWLAAALIDEP